MVEAITAQRLGILQFVAKNPGVAKAQIVAARGATEADLKYLEELDLIREREVGCYRVSHMGEMVLRRSL